MLTPTVLFDQAVTPTVGPLTCATAPIDITGYRTVVIHSREVNDIYLKLGEAAGFVRDQSISSIATVAPVLRHQMILQWFLSGVAAPCASHAFTVVGYK